MITIYGLYFLLLMELLAVLAATTVLFFMRSRKYRGRYQSTQQELSDAESMLESLKRKLAEHKAQAEMQSAAASSAAPADEQESAENASGGLIARVAELESQIQEKDKKMSALETKFADLEKEYMVLYQQQQQQQSQPDID